MSKNLNSKLKNEENYTCDPSKRGVEGSTGVLGHRPYGERSSELKNEENYTCDPSKRGIKGSSGALGRRPYG
jgi:hypothetical protein